jgi:NADPH:quinone reductase-like Zn-dependent oxidoreductase
MRAIVQQGYGDADVLRVAEIDRPAPAAGEVLVEVRAAGLDRGTWHLMTGRPYAVRLAVGLRGPRRPVAGRDLAGVVAAVGPGVTRFAVGDEVYGTASGSFAEFVAARVDRLAAKPTRLTFAQAATVPISGGTALRALTDAGRVRAGQRVLVIGASGGVGSFAVQLAKAFGAEVDGVCGPAKADLVRSLGATEVFDRTHDDFLDGSRRYDLILDIAGNRPVSRLRRALTPTGTLVFVGGEQGDPVTGGMGRQVGAAVVSMFGRQRLTGFVPKESAEVCERLAALIDDGSVSPSVDAEYPLARVPEAMRRLAAGEVRGKVAITL